MWVLRGPDEQANLGQHKDPVVSLGNRSRVGEGEDCYSTAMDWTVRQERL